MLHTVDFPPGLFQNGTQYSIKKRWFDGNLIRWINNQLQPIGGWKSFESITASEPIRAIFSYVDNDVSPRHIFGSADKLYHIDEGAANKDDITPGTLNYNPGGQIGYGSGAYGSGAYGTRVPSSVEINEADVWSFDNLGEILVASHSGDGRLFTWDPNTPSTDAAAIAGTDAPTGVIDMVVTNERHIMAFGVDGDPRLIRWASRESTDFDVSSLTNTAGEFVLQSKGRIIKAVKVFNGILVITDDDAHLVYFVGGSVVYASQKVGDNCGCLSNKSVVAIPSGAVWPGKSHFWIYNGTVELLPCDLLDLFYSGNILTPQLVHGGYNEKFDEVWFFRPMAGGSQPTEAIIWSKRNKPFYWTRAEVTRHAMGSYVLSNQPFMAEDQEIFIHEQGYLDEAASRTNIYVESAVLQLGSGDRVMHATELYQDAVYSGSSFPYHVKFFVSQAPGKTPIEKGPYLYNTVKGYTTMRWRGRQAIMRIEQIVDKYWENGEIRIKLKEGGMR